MRSLALQLKTIEVGSWNSLSVCESKQYEKIRSFLCILHGNSNVSRYKYFLYVPIQMHFMQLLYMVEEEKINKKCISTVLKTCTSIVVHEYSSKSTISGKNSYFMNTYASLLFTRLIHLFLLFYRTILRRILNFACLDAILTRTTHKFTAKQPKKISYIL